MTSKYESNANEVKRALRGAERRVLEAIGVFVVGETQVRCPVLTGNLRSSYTHKADESAGVVHIGTNVDYAPWVELGTRRMAAQPHLRPAVEQNITRIRRLAEETYKP